MTEDTERMKILLGLNPCEALEQINALGNDFTLEEINEFSEMMSTAIERGELNAEALDDVAGGGKILDALAPYVPAITATINVIGNIFCAFINKAPAPAPANR